MENYIREESDKYEKLYKKIFFFDDFLIIYIVWWDTNKLGYPFILA